VQGGYGEESSLSTVSTMTDRAVEDVAADADDVRLLALLADGLVLYAIARRLDFSERTVRRRIRSLCDRMGVDTPMQAIVRAVHAGVLYPDSGVETEHGPHLGNYVIVTPGELRDRPHDPTALCRSGCQR
jgi:DNA-binding CsgD family transcriptional regulator